MTTTARTANSGSPTRPGPWPELRGSPPVGSGLGDAARAARGARASQATSAVPTVATWPGRAVACHATAPMTASNPPTTRSPRPTASKPAATSGRSRARRRSGRASPRRARAWSGRAAGRGRRSCAARRPSSRLGTPSTIACSTDETCSIRRRTGVSRASRRARDPGRRPRCRPTRAGRRRARCRARVVDDDRVEALADLEADRAPGCPRRSPSPSLAADLEARPAEDQRPVGVVLELVLGVDPAVRPGRSAAGPAASARASATLTSGVEASRRPTR